MTRIIPKAIIPRFVLALLAGGLVAGCDEAGKTAADPALIAQGGQLFGEICGSCHNVPGAPPDDTKVCPPLKGVIGRKAGSVPGYPYSQAFLNAGFTWDEAKLNAYIESPQKVVPGNAMAFFGEPDPELRKAIVAYLVDVSK